jgi:hypothetical protein
MTISTHVVHARNWATTSANRIHSDDIAGQYGFRGGLVPGVTSIAYTIPAVVAALGEEWLDHGTLDVRLTSPVYDEEVVKVVVDDGGSVRLVGEAEDDDRLIASATIGPTDRASLDVPPAAVLPEIPPDASPESLARSTVLGSLHHVADPVRVAAYLASINDAGALASTGAVHPGWLLLDANEVLSANVTLGPWVHVGSDLRLHRRVAFDEELETRAVVRAEYERKGHRFVELDVVTLASGEPALSTRHTAIYRLRQP